MQIKPVEINDKFISCNIFINEFNRLRMHVNVLVYCLTLFDITDNVISWRVKQIQKMHVIIYTAQLLTTVCL